MRPYPYNCYRQQDMARAFLFYLAVLEIRRYNAAQDARREARDARKRALSAV